MITANWTEWVSSRAWCTAGVELLPPAPRALAEVFWLADQQDVDTRRLIDLVSKDPVFAIRVLRLANVAAFAAAGEVKSVEIAVVRLGTRAVRHAVLAACFSTWAHTIDAHGRRGTGEIQHAIGTACLARRIAQRLSLPGDDAFVHGLLHDVGKLVLLRLRSTYLRLGGRAPSPQDFEAVMGDRHGDVGAAALEMWGIPESVREPVRWHHAPLQAGEHVHASSLLYLSNRLSYRYGFGRQPAGGAAPLEDDEVLASLELPHGLLAELDREAVSLGMAAQHLVS